MKKVVTIQRAAQVDGLYEDGTPRYQLPHPVHVDHKGMICQQDFWQGRLHRVIGFQDNVRVKRIDLWWEDVCIDPTRAIGKYLVCSDSKGNWFVFETGVESSQHAEVPKGF